jgi:hypothetical protein
MSDLRKQIRDHYHAQSLPAEKAEAIVARGYEAAGDAVSREKVVSFPRRRPITLALAAGLALFAGLALWRSHEAKRVSFAAVAPHVIEFFSGPHELTKRSRNPEELRAWLLAQGAPADFQIPAKLQPLESFGCRVLDVDGRPAFVTCFWARKPSAAEKGALVHLVVTKRSDFREGPTSAAPQFREMNGWSFASWRAGDSTYTLATAAPVEKLREFVAAQASAAVRWAMRETVVPINS